MARMVVWTAQPLSALHETPTHATRVRRTRGLGGVMQPKRS